MWERLDGADPAIADWRRKSRSRIIDLLEMFVNTKEQIYSPVGDKANGNK
jgi:hypothetical protein